MSINFFRLSCLRWITWSWLSISEPWLLYLGPINDNQRNWARWGAIRQEISTIIRTTGINKLIRIPGPRHRISKISKASSNRQQKSSPGLVIWPLTNIPWRGTWIANTKIRKYQYTNRSQFQTVPRTKLSNLADRIPIYWIKARSSWPSPRTASRKRSKNRKRVVTSIITIICWMWATRDTKERRTITKVRRF